MTRTQCRMARAACKLSLRDIAMHIGVSPQAIGRWESGKATISHATVCRIRAWFEAQRIFFGPSDSVSCDQHPLMQERYMVTALMQLLREKGIHPSSRDIINAFERSIPNSWLRRESAEQDTRR